MKNHINYFVLSSDIVRNNAIRAVANTPIGEYEVRITKKDKGRTNQQNKYYWGPVLETFSQETGFSKEELHDHLRARFLGVKKRQVENVELVELVSTTSLSTNEFNEYLDKIVGAGMLMGFTIPTPEYHGLGGTPSHRGFPEKPCEPPAGTLGGHHE